MKKITVLLLMMIVSLLAQEKFARIQNEYNPQKYICYRSDGSLKIDGKMDEKIWAAAPWTNYFTDIEGNLKPLPYYKTRMKMLWDNDYIYFAAELEDKHIWATLKQRDAVIFYDNDFEIFIDPDGDTQNYYELEVNAFETAWDLLLLKPYRDGEKVAVNGWDIKELKVAVNVEGTINNPADEDKKWTVEIAIPWTSINELNFVPTPPKFNDQWKINFSRVQWETEIINGTYVKKKDKNGKNLPENNWVWSQQGLIAMHAPETWGLVQFSGYVAGKQEDKFIENSLEEARWALRNLYYAQQDYFIKTKKYTTDLKKLVLKNFQLKEYNWNPVIKVADKYFEAFITSKNGKTRLYIYNDGLVKIVNK